MLRRPTLVFLLAAASTAGVALGQQPPRAPRIVDRRVHASWFPAEGEHGPWPPPGSAIDAVALDCTFVGAGGAQPVRCRVLHLADELRASASRLASCYALHEVRLRPAQLRHYATTGWPPGRTLVFVAEHTHDVVDVRGKCHARGIDGCMSEAAYPVVGHRIERHVEHRVAAWAGLTAGPFDALDGQLPWLEPEGAGATWPAAPTNGPYDERPLTAIAADAAASLDVRFAAEVDLVSARLVSGDADGARRALANIDATPAQRETVDFLRHVAAQRWTDPCATPARPAPPVTPGP